MILDLERVLKQFKRVRDLNKLKILLSYQLLKRGEDTFPQHE